MEVRSTIRPKLKQDSVFLPSGNGVVLRNGSHLCFFKGQTIYRWLSSLAPYLNGEQTLEELCEPLDAKRREMVSTLVKTLLEKGILKNHIPEEPGLLAPAVRQRFDSQIEFIDHFAERPLQRFKEFREGRVLLAGSGHAFMSLARTLLRNGMESLYLAPSGGGEFDPEALEQEVAALGRQGVPANISERELDVRGLAERGESYSLVVYCCDGRALNSVRELHEQCWREGIQFLPAVVFNGESLLGPLVKPGVAGCWLCAMLRYSSNLDAPHAADLWKRMMLDDGAGGGGADFVTTAAMLGNNTAFEIFKAMAGHLPPETEGGVLAQDLETLESSRSRVWPHPLCPVCARPDARSEAGRVSEVVTRQHDCELSVEERLHKSNQFIEPRLGIFRAFEDAEAAQIPLRTTSLRFGSPADHAAGTISVVRYGVENTFEARDRALADASERYSRLVASKRRAEQFSYATLADSEPKPVSPEELSLWSGRQSFDPRAEMEWLPGYALFGQSLRYVPAAAVHPTSSLNRRGAFEAVAYGGSAAATFDELLSGCLLSALTGERLREVAGGAGGVFSLDADLLSSLDRDVAYLLKTARRLGTEFRLLELAGEGPVRVVLPTPGGGAAPSGAPVQPGSSLTLAGAVREALTNALGAIQGGAANDRAPAVESSSTGFTLPPDTEITPLGAGRYSPAPDASSIEDFLRRKGREVFLVNTTPDDLWGAGIFMTGRVLLSRACTA